MRPLLETTDRRHINCQVLVYFWGIECHEWSSRAYTNFKWPDWPAGLRQNVADGSPWCCSARWPPAVRQASTQGNTNKHPQLHRPTAGGGMWLVEHFCRYLFYCSQLHPPWYIYVQLVHRSSLRDRPWRRSHTVKSLGNVCFQESLVKQATTGNMLARTQGASVELAALKMKGLGPLCEET